MKVTGAHTFIEPCHFGQIVKRSDLKFLVYNQEYCLCLCAQWFSQIQSTLRNKKYYMYVRTGLDSQWLSF